MHEPSDAAIEAAAEALYDSPLEDWEDTTERHRQATRDTARFVLETALPIIREELASEIENEIERLVRMMGPGDSDQGMWDAARIVRGDNDA